MKKLSNKRKKNLIKIYFTTLAIFMACAIGLIGCGMLFTEAMDEDDKEKASEFVSDLSSELKSFFEYEPEKELSQEADADEDDSTEGSDTAKANDPAEAQKATDADNSAKESGTTGSSSPFGGGILKSTADINLHSADGGKKNYVFTYNGTDFSAIYTADNWKVIDSYLIDNTEDITIICEALIAEHPIHGSDMQSYRTAEDMAYEWEQHNIAYTFLPEGNRWKEKIKDVDLNPADQGLSFDEIYERQTGKKITIEEILKHIG